MSNEIEIYECKQCKTWFTTKMDLDEHFWVHTNEIRFVCEVCRKSFGKSEALKEHMQIHEKRYQCNYCDKSFSQNSILKRHILIHKGKKFHKCEHCTKSFYIYAKLEKHMNCHKDEKFYKCQKCNELFFYKYDLQRHLCSDARKNSYFKPEEDNKLYRSFVSLNCLSPSKYNTNKLFATNNNKSQLAVTSENKNSDSVVDDGLSSGHNFKVATHMCLWCNALFFTRSELLKHLKSHINL